MRIILLALMFCSASLIAADDPAVTGRMSNGKAWAGLGGTDDKLAVQLKFIFLLGLADGFQQAQGELVPVLFSKPTLGQEEKVAEITPALLPVGKDFPTMIVALDEFYADAQSLEIPIPVAARYTKAALEGRDPKQLEESLGRLRILYKMTKELDSLQRK